MKNNHIKLLATKFIFTVIFIGLLSCETETTEEVNVLEKAASVAKIDEIDSNVSQELKEMADLEAIQALDNIATLFSTADFLSSSESSARLGSSKKLSLKSKNDILTFVQNQSNAITRIVSTATDDGRSNDDVDFDFEGHKGVYDWSENEQDFVKVGESEFIVLNFPNGSDPSVLDGTFSLTEYNEIKITDSFNYDFYAITSVKANMTVAGEEVMSLNLSGEYDAEGTPTAADVNIGMPPFSFVEKFENNSNSLTSSTSISKNADVLIGVDLQANFDAEQMLSDANLNFVYGDMTVKGNISSDNVNSETADINDVINLEVLQNNDKLGDIVFEQGYAYLQYSDGTKERLEDVFEDTIIEVEEMLNGFDDI